MNTEDFGAYINNLKIEHQINEEIKQSKIETLDQFKGIRLEDIQKNQSQGPNISKKWAIEDETDLSNFYDVLPKDQFAYKYDFELDDFQKRAILRLENNQSVLVCAHTSAGKTVIAEYSIALALRHKRKVVYTSPIKALSNEKYMKFSKLFQGDVGIITGDVSLNPNASCLIMTTEILRNMLYKQNDIIRDIEWVIFDEVHYVNDVERGVVWEETIIMMPSYIQIIMLSATVPNYKDFANWVGKTIQKQIYIQKTFIRPIPLEHSIYIYGRFHLIKEQDNPFLQKEYDIFMKNINNQVRELSIEKNQELYDKKQKGVFKNKFRQQKFMQKTSTRFIEQISKEDLQNPENRRQNKIIIDLIHHCEKQDLLPCVIFVFSKAKIMELAQACSHLNFVTKAQESQIISFYDKSIRKLKKQDQQIPQLLNIRNLLRKGFAIHHGDILPIAKEITEILFSEGLLKVLFATETMAMGVNMPTKTVIFHQIQKHDGIGKRNLNSSEYTQMSGRAGRRGIDEKGNVIICISNIRQLPSTEDMVQIIDNYGEQLESKYKITYSVIFNKMNSSDMNVIDMMRQSFCENDKYMFRDYNIKKYKELKQQYENIQNFDCILGDFNAPIDKFINNYRNLKNTNQQILIQSKKMIYNMQFPKFALIIGYNQRIELCIILGVINNKKSADNQDIYLEVLLSTNNKEQKKQKIILEIESKNQDNPTYQNVKIKNIQFAYRISEVCLYEILEIFNEIITIQDDGSRRALEDLADYLDELKFKTNLEDFKNFYSNKKKKFNSIFYKENKELQQIKKIIVRDFFDSKCFNCKLQDQHVQQFRNREYLRQDIEDMFKKLDQNELQENQNLNLRIEILIKFKYFDENRQPLIKAAIARELGNEGIYLCETLVNNILVDLEYRELAAILSGFVCQFQNKKIKKVYHPLEIIKKDVLWTDKMKQAAQQIYDICYSIVREEMQLGITLADLDESEYIFQHILNFNLAKTIYFWADQKDFVDIIEHSDAQEGNIVRTIIRLENVIRNMKSASKVVGNMKMYQNLEKCQEIIKRDIVFTESLYLQLD